MIEGVPLHFREGAPMGRVSLPSYMVETSFVYMTPCETKK